MKDWIKRLFNRRNGGGPADCNPIVAQCGGCQSYFWADRLWPIAVQPGVTADSDDEPEVRRFCAVCLNEMEVPTWARG